MKEIREKMKIKRAHHPGLTTVHVAAGLLRAQVIKTKLENAGIPVLLDYESLGPVIGLTVDGLGEVRVLTPDENADEARALIKEKPKEEQEQWEREWEWEKEEG